MQTITSNKFINNFDDYFRQAVLQNQLIVVADEIGTGVFLSEEEYNGLIATLELTADSRFLSQLLEADSEPLSECRVYNQSEEW